METFVLRVWTPDEPSGTDEPGGLRGVIRHVATGEEHVFRGTDDLISFVHRVAASAEPDRRH